MNAQRWDANLALACIRELEQLPGALLPVLHALQTQFGYIDAAAIPMVADALNLSVAEVYGAVGFYHDFRRQPPGRHVLRVCRAEACQAMGGEALIRHIECRVGARVGETSADGSVTVEAVYCLGNCALSPSLMLDGNLYGRVSAATADVLLDDTQRPS
jgi:formate dehydrogenase subunit gamma